MSLWIVFPQAKRAHCWCLVTPESERQRWCNGLEDQCQERPVVLVIDDLHWADGSSLNVLMYVLAGPADRQLAVSPACAAATWATAIRGSVGWPRFAVFLGSSNCFWDLSTASRPTISSTPICCAGIGDWRECVLARADEIFQITELGERHMDALNLRYVAEAGRARQDPDNGELARAQLAEEHRDVELSGSVSVSSDGWPCLRAKLTTSAASNTAHIATDK